MSDTANAIAKTYVGLTFTELKSDDDFSCICP